MTPLRVVRIWTDGATKRTEQKKRVRIGAGIVAVCEGRRKEWSLDLGEGTSQQAELFAIYRALELLDERHTLAVTVVTDSQYCWGLLSKQWKAVANVQLVLRLRELTSQFGAFHCTWTPGHADCVENNRADQLARQALRGTG